MVLNVNHPPKNKTRDQTLGRNQIMPTDCRNSADAAVRPTNESHVKRCRASQVDHTEQRE
ncbi:MAG TPA: hypothetical protein DDX19_05115 [Rhodopirellula baltica]|uniref:Uncharacterized protein n=1 Tax=Rhodopirellula baltica (strain DSM 10527 / NCIMB 13988 / SH1) TaxID=243090 RepID=Q7UDZ0_RHOBA|nr:hypothetical protein RB11685 [Rhodopirellula baltica SH 1]HBE62142.1 hypothetical protein [Rhodopirellula baltica]